MTKLIIKLFIGKHDNASDPTVREKFGKVAAATGLICNIVLFGSKLLIGALFQSISIMADAFNNLSDAGSSVITLIGFRMSGKPADKEHPYGHARIEYISGFVISIVILLLGIELIRSSVDKIINPNPINFSLVTVAVLLLAIGIKLWMGMFYKGIGKRINSGALRAASVDSLNDVYTTGSVLISVLFAQFTGVQIDGFMGVGIALFIIFSGIKLVKVTLNPLLGEAPDQALVSKIEDKIRAYPGVIGLHDLVLHNYGPERCFASVHVEVPADQDILESHEIIDRIEKDFNAELNIHLVIHMDPIVTHDERINNLKEIVGSIVCAIDPVLTIHDFRAVVGKQHSNLIFDITIPPGYQISDKELTSRIIREIRNVDTEYYPVITLDRSYTSSTHRET